MERRVFVIAASICLLVITLPLAITSIVISQTEKDSCDIIDYGTKLSVSDCLLAAGIVSLIYSVVISIVIPLCYWYPVALGVLITSNIINALFTVAWTIIFGITLYRANIDCIREGTILMIYSIVIWSIGAISALKGCCGI